MRRPRQPRPWTDDSLPSESQAETKAASVGLDRKYLGHKPTTHGIKETGTPRHRTHSLRESGR